MVGGIGFRSELSPWTSGIKLADDGHIDISGSTSHAIARRIDRCDRAYDASSAMSSPLTSLSSLGEEDMDESFSLGPPAQTFDLDELRAAMVSFHVSVFCSRQHC